MLHRRKTWLLASLSLFLTINSARCGPATDDSLEQFNRAMYEFNQKYYSSPQTGANQFFTETVPLDVRRGFSNFFTNLTEPVVAVSSLAQGDFDNATLATKRFFYNLVWGYGGVVDRASDLGVNPEPRNMGEVICAYGVPDGPFLVLPFYGPVTVSDFVGSTLPLVAGYVAFGEAFFIFRAGSRVASFMDDKKDDKKSDPAPTPNSRESVTPEDYGAVKEHYLAARATPCGRHLLDIPAEARAATPDPGKGPPFSTKN